MLNILERASPNFSKCREDNLKAWLEVCRNWLALHSSGLIRGLDREAARMQMVYSNSFLNIAATSAPNVQLGRFFKRDTCMISRPAIKLHDIKTNFEHGSPRKWWRRMMLSHVTQMSHWINEHELYRKELLHKRTLFHEEPDYLRVWLKLLLETWPRGYAALHILGFTTSQLKRVMLRGLGQLALRDRFYTA